MTPCQSADSRPLHGARRPHGLHAAFASLCAALALTWSVPGPVQAQTHTAPIQKKSAKPASKKAGPKKAAKPTRGKPRKNAPPSAIAGSSAAPGMLAAQTALQRSQQADAAAAQAAKQLKAAGQPALSPADVLAASPPEAWRQPELHNLLLLEFEAAPGGVARAPVLIELAPRFAPAHVENLRALVRGAYFDGLAVLRVQENYVTQWGDGVEVGNGEPRPLPAPAHTKLPAEFDTALAGLPLDALAETDGWSELNGFVDGFPVAAEPSKTPAGRAWLAHCYGNVGAGRGNELDSSTGASLYAVIGHAARGLDLNITSVGRVIKGMETLGALPRGSGTLGFYTGSERKLPLLRARLLADLPPAERPSVQVLRTDTPTWHAWLHARRHRGGWFVHSSGRVDLCSTQVPVRVGAPGG